MKSPEFNLKKIKSSSRHLGMGAVNFWEETDTGIEGKSDSGKFRFIVYDSGMIRIQMTRYSDFESNPYSVVSDPKNVKFSVHEKKDLLILQTEKLTLQVNLKRLSLSFFDADGNILNADDSLGTAWIGTEVTTYKQVQKNEKFIGLGEKTGNLNRFGKAYTNWNTDYFGYGISDDPLYMSIPFYIGIHDQGAYGIFLDNTHKTVFNFGASTNRFIYFNAEDGDMDYYFIHEPNVAGIISSYTELTGRMQLPPKWALGFQQCRYSYYPDKEVLTVAKNFRDKKMPADVIYLDIHHMEAYKVFTFDGEKFPDAKAMIQALKSKGFRVVVILDPGIKTEEGYQPYEEGKVKDLFVKYPDGQEYEAQVWPGWCTFPDFTKKETRTWWAEKMAFYTEAGVDGFWTDMNEPASWGQFTPNLIEFDYEGSTASHRQARNIYGMQMARSTQEGALVQNETERAFVLTRSGFSGIQRYAAAWTGDNTASEEHMLAGVRLINSLGLSGVAFSGYDVGGFAGESSKSLFARWMSIAAFSPLYRAHSMINSNDAEPWAFGEEVEEISRNYMNLRYQLLPTIYAAFYEASQTGLPLVSSLAIDYPDDLSIYSSAFQNQYLFCNRFLVAPVESFKEITKVYLPKGKWYYLYSDQIYNGENTIYADCPINYLPVYVKAGSIFSMQSEVFSTGEPHDGVLRIHIYQGSDESSFVHYEDDGISHNYRSGHFLKRKISYKPKSNQIIFAKSEGDYSSDFKTVKVFLHGFTTNTVSINAQTVNLDFEDFAFLSRLTQFDPLPENDHPYYEIKNIRTFELTHSNDEIRIDLKA